MYIRLLFIVSFAHQEDARTQVRILLPKLVASFQILLGNDVRLHQAIPLKIGQCLEEYAGAVNHFEACRHGVSLQRIQILRGEGRILDVMRLGHQELAAWVEGLGL